MIGGELDLLPEEIEWRDQGCEFYPSCLNCPLPRCVEDEPRGLQRLRMAARKKRMEELRRLGRSVKDIAELFGVSRRTVQRALENKKPKTKKFFEI
jgi:DNA-binding CsgD family transcriptional regulator